MNFEGLVLKKKWFEVPNLLHGFLTKYHRSLNNPSRPNSDFREQIFSDDFNNSGETEEVVKIFSMKGLQNNLFSENMNISN